MFRNTKYLRPASSGVGVFRLHRHIVDCPADTSCRRSCWQGALCDPEHLDVLIAIDHGRIGAFAATPSGVGGIVPVDGLLPSRANAMMSARWCQSQSRRAARLRHAPTFSAARRSSYAGRRVSKARLSSVPRLFARLGNCQLASAESVSLFSWAGKCAHRGRGQSRSCIGWESAAESFPWLGTRARGTGCKPSRGGGEICHFGGYAIVVEVT